MISEGYTNKNSFAYQLDPRVKIVAVFFFSVIVAVSNRFVALSAALTLALCAVMLAKVSPKEFVRRLIPVNIFILFLWIFLPFSTQGKPLLAIAGLVATYEGVTYAAQITIKSNAIMAALIVLISSTPILTLGHALHELKVPQKLIHLFFFTYRYIHVIHREYLRLLNAMKVRAFNPGTNMHTYKTFAHLVGMLLVRSSDRAERVHNAMLCRNFTGRLYSLKHFSFNRTDCLSLFVTLSLIAALGLLKWARLV